MTEEVGFSRLAGILRRRTWPVAIVAIATAATGLLIVKQLPKTYQARAVMRINDPHPPHDYVVSTVNEPNDRLKSRRLTFLARPVVLDAAMRSGMIAADASEAEQDAAAASIEGRLDARQDGEDTFVITFQDGDPARAQAFLDALTRAYVEQRSKENADHASQTSSFFAKQVEELRPRVARAEADVEKFRTRHYGELPEQLDANLRVLDQVQLEAHSVRTSLDSTLTRRITFLTDINSPIRHEEEEAARALTNARARYAADSPEVKNLEAELQRVRQERRADEADLKSQARHSPELAAMQVETASLLGRLDELAAKELELRAKIDGASKTAEELAKLSLDRDILRDHLKTLEQKAEEAALASALESDVAGHARISVVEPAFASAESVKPAKPFLASLAVAIALVLALGLGWALDAADGRVRTPADVKLLTGDLPLLGVVPRLPRGLFGKDTDKGARA